MPEEKSYFFNSSEPALFVEIYFPKRSAYYGAIFDALREGYDENIVKEYLRSNVERLINEFVAFPDLLRPDRYTSINRALPSVSEALARIDMYKSPFGGWSVYSVDGVFFDNEGKPIAEATQVVRVMFRFESSFIKQAINESCFDVLRAILFWTVSRRGRLYEHKSWGKHEKARFIEQHKPWPKQKIAFVQKYYTDITIEVGKWLDDREIFVFCYLVRNFWERVVAEGFREDEIWVTSLLNLVVNVVKPIKPSLAVP